MYYGEHEAAVKTFTSSFSHHIVEPVKATHGKITIYMVCVLKCASNVLQGPATQPLV
jgi:hypothetical protein